MGIRARLSPSAEAGRCRTPTLRVDTPPPQEGPTCTRTPHSSLPPTIPGGRTTKDPGAPLLSAVCVSPSPWHSPGSGAAKIRKTPRLPARMGQLHAANLSTWRVPRNSEKPQNGPNNGTARKTTKSRKNKTTRARSNGSSSQQEDELHKRRDQEREPTQDKHEAFHERRRERADPEWSRDVCAPQLGTLPGRRRERQTPQEQRRGNRERPRAGALPNKVIGKRQYKYRVVLGTVAQLWCTRSLPWLNTETVHA